MYITLERCDIHWIHWVRCERPIGTQLRNEQKQKREKTANATRTLLKLIAGSIEVKRENGFGYGRIDTGVQSKHQWLVHA